MMIEQILSKLVEREDLPTEEMRRTMDSLMEGEATDAQKGAFLAALRMKGETVQELAGAASSMRQHATFIDAGFRSVVDTCGTGGDGADTFNISTATAFVTAGAGVTVAKHGNRAVSSVCGSADVLAQLGVNIEAEADVIEECIQEHGIGFLFAPRMHPAMKNVASSRRELGIRTIFNMLGPLTNPAGATGQVLGVFSPELTETFAYVLRDLHAHRAYIVHGHDGLDEISAADLTRVSELNQGRVTTYDISPEMLLGGFADPADYAGGDPSYNATLLRQVLSGENKDGATQIVLMNAAAAIAAGDAADGIEDGLEKARESINSGAAEEKLQRLIEATQ